MVDRVIFMVVEGLGVGRTLDFQEPQEPQEPNDTGPNTLAHVAKITGGLALPTLESLGLGCVGSFLGLRQPGQPDGCFGRMRGASSGVDSMVGHWELAGVFLDRPLPTYPSGLPPEALERFQREIGRNIVGNCEASANDVLERWGQDHLRTGSPIVYTSGDSAVRVAAHDRAIPACEVYEMCRLLRKSMGSHDRVGRVVARPFTGEPGSFVWGGGRRDFSIDPPKQTLLDHVHRGGHLVIGVGKIGDLFNKRGLTRSIHTRNNADAFAETAQVLKTVPRGLIVVNLDDVDHLHGPRTDPKGFAAVWETVDRRLMTLVKALRPTDLLCVTADHGHDPTMDHLGHTQEEVPVLVYGPRVARGVNLGTRRTMADLGQTVAEALGADPLSHGESFYNVLTPM